MHVRAHRQIVVYVVLVLAISWAYEAYIVANGGVRAFGPAAVFALMCIPGLLSLAMRVAFRSGFADVGFVAGRARHYAYAIGIPCAVAAILASACALADIRELDALAADDLRRAAPAFLAIAGLGLVGAFGEELGWRGYLLPKMIAAGIRRPYLASNAVWAAWHLPLIAFGGFYATEAVLPMTVAYALGIIAMGFVISELRLRSRSVFVATVCHAAHNFVFQIVVPVIVLTQPGERAEWWDVVGGDTGFLVGALYALAFLALRRTTGARTVPPD